jgi:hypothetical protein
MSLQLFRLRPVATAEVFMICLFYDFRNSLGSCMVFDIHYKTWISIWISFSGLQFAFKMTLN